MPFGTGEEAVEGTPVPSDDEPACFPAAATVELADGSTTELAALSAGMAVRVAQGAHTGAHSHVYGWSHRQLDGRHTYVRLSHVPEAAAGDERPAPRHLLLSPGHLLYVGGSLVPARSVRVGDALATPGVAGGVSRVVATGTTTAAGKVNPHTLSGDLLVDGVRVSTYTDALPTVVAHALLAPARAAFRAGLSVEPMGRLLYGGVPGWRRWWA
ncbi:hypothetical protein I4F81_001117 [Pyropia yezoensis]|uniref:Uncharacterized protein n=1 Tax=Pyropia yezoensis TaxID=2788 RepID=A0ACC3BM22_PYRYE|nr:hypothetical protein I4F81_001117 [Neopyropia yezoensis]